MARPKLQLEEIERFREKLVALVHESDSSAKVSSAVLIGYLTANDFGLPSSNIRFRMLHAIGASASRDSRTNAHARMGGIPIYYEWRAA